MTNYNLKYFGIAFIGFSTLIILFLLALSGCAGGGVVSPPVEPTSKSETSVAVPSTAAPTETPPPFTEKPEVYNFLLMGGDYRAHREGTGRGNNTDVMLLVNIRRTDPVEIKVIQFPRNFYHPVENFPDMWMFNVYGSEGVSGVHYYFQEIFEIPISGMAYIHMDNFIEFVDGLGGLWLDGSVRSGEAALAYLRDNDNNWGCPEYDCGDRQFLVLEALSDKVKIQFSESPFQTAEELFKVYGGLFETDLSEFEQIVQVIDLGWFVASHERRIEFIKFTESGFIEYGDTPLEVRGWVAVGDLKEWVWYTLGG